MSAREYEDHDIAGWRVTCEVGLWRLKEDTLRVLGDRLVEIDEVLPRLPLASLKKVRFFVDSNPWYESPFCYHNSGCGPFLLGRGETMDKLLSINVINPERFVPLASDPRHFPGTVLHELAHAYHDQFLPGGYNNPDIIKGYHDALAKGIYKNVLNVTGVWQPSNAIADKLEYFASSTVSYFMTNDDEPKNRAELASHDPETYALIERLWGA